MNKAETGAGALVVVIGAALLAGAMRFPLFLQGVPGPGFLPLAISIGILAAGFVLTVKALRAGERTVDATLWPPLAGWARLGIMLAAMALAFLLLDVLGFLVVTTLFMAAMIVCLGERSWRVLALVPVLSALGLYLVFAVWLRVPLPKGIVTFLG